MTDNLIPVTVVLEPRTMEVDVFKGHLTDGDMRTLGETAAHGHVFYIATEHPTVFHLHSKGDGNKHLIITHTYLIEGK
jgi:hypothetical protein